MAEASETAPTTEGAAANTDVEGLDEFASGGVVSANQEEDILSKILHGGPVKTRRRVPLCNVLANPNTFNDRCTCINLLELNYKTSTHPAKSKQNRRNPDPPHRKF